MARTLKAKPLSLPPAAEQMAQERIKRFLAERFELEIGRFEAQEVLELFYEHIAPGLYDQAISDAQALISDRFASLESDLWALQKS